MATQAGQIEVERHRMLSQVSMMVEFSEKRESESDSISAVIFKGYIYIYIYI